MYAFNTMLWMAKFINKPTLSIFDILLWVGVVIYLAKIETFGLYNLFVLIAVALVATIIEIIVNSMDYLKE